MRILVALGGNALLRRNERPDADIQQHHIEDAVAALADILCDHEVIITHGNGPQVGMLAIESATDSALTRPYPLDALVAQTQGMIGYWIAQSIHNLLPQQNVVALLTQTVVDRNDPAFQTPTKFVGPTYSHRELSAIAKQHSWNMAADGDAWRRVVASPEPQAVVELPLIQMLVDAKVVVVCAGGGGIPVEALSNGRRTGVEAVVDKDFTAALLAESLGADRLLLLTDVSAVESDYGTPDARPLRDTTPDELRLLNFPAGSMRPKVEAACRFVDHTGNPAGIGSLLDATAILNGHAGTTIRSRHHRIESAAQSCL